MSDSEKFSRNNDIHDYEEVLDILNYCRSTWTEPCAHGFSFIMFSVLLCINLKS